MVIGGSLFGVGTLPWQQNFTGLLGGMTFGITLTLALVPFVSITKYVRKSKVRSNYKFSVCIHKIFLCDKKKL